MQRTTKAGYDAGPEELRPGPPPLPPHDDSSRGRWTDLFSQPSPSSSAPTRQQFPGQICSHNPLPPPLPPHDNSSLDRSVLTTLSLLLCPHTTTVPWTDLFSQPSPSSSAPTRQQFPGQICSHSSLPPPLSPHDDSSRFRWTDLFTQPAPSSASQASTATTGRGRAEMLRWSTCY
ncbi:hypothetical protein ACOMHN_010398 [Nucella lapillus]